MGRGRGRRSGNQLLTRLNKALGGFGKFETEQRAAGRQDQINARRHKRLMLAVNFPQTAFGAITVNGVTHGSARGDDTDARIDRQPGGPDTPREQKNSAINPSTLLANRAKIGIAPQALTGGQAHGRARCGGHAVLLDDREALTTFTAAISEDSAAAFGGFAGTETDFAGAF